MSSAAIDPTWLDGAMASRELTELLALAERHMRLLKAYAREAFDNGNEDYLGEVAGKLRLLVSEEGSNKPLLLKLLDEFDDDGSFELHQPGLPNRVSLREFIRMDAFAQRTPYGDLVEFKKIDLVKTYAEKFGAAHVDWTLPQDFRDALEQAVSIQGLHPIQWEIKSVVRAVVHAWEQFRESLTTNLVIEKTVRRIEKRDCQTAGAHNEKGELLAAAGKHGKAAQSFRAAVQAEPDNFRYQINLARSIGHLRKLEEIESTYDRLLEKFPEQETTVRHYYAIALCEKEQVEDAINQFNRVLELRRSGDAYHGRGVCWLAAYDQASTESQGSYLSKAAADFEAAISLNPDSAGSYYSLAAVYSMQGELAASLKCLEKVQQLGGWKNFSPVGDPEFRAVVDHEVYGDRVRSLFADVPVRR